MAQKSAAALDDALKAIQHMAGRVALAWAHLAAGDPARARAEDQRAREMSVEMGYHWGRVDTEELLGGIGG